MERIFVLLSILIGLNSCSKNDLSKDEALSLVNSEKGYPRALEYEIFTADPEFASKLSGSQLETEGFVIVQKTQKMSDMGEPLIKFTEKAKPYLLLASSEDEKLAIQKVRLADEEVAEIRGIVKSKNDGAMEVTYMTRYTNKSPFALLSKNLDQSREVVAAFKHDGEKWQLVKGSK